MFEKGSIVYVLPGFQYASKTSFREKTHTHTHSHKENKKKLYPMMECLKSSSAAGRTGLRLLNHREIKVLKLIQSVIWK